jgi:putative membrane protein
MKRVIFGLIAASIVSSPAFAQSAKTTDFITAAQVGGKVEVEAGQIAAQKATNPEVKKFGRQMVEDHSKANSDLKMTLAKDQSGKSLPPDVPFDAQTRDMIDKLKTASGDEFDKTYVDAMVKDHKEDVELFTGYTKTGDDETIRAFAQRTLPVLKQHLKMIEAIQKTATKK